MQEAEATGLLKKFKLTSTISTSNMTLFDEFGRVHKYETAEALLRSFYALRLAHYEKRKMEWTSGHPKARASSPQAPLASPSPHRAPLPTSQPPPPERPPQPQRPRTGPSTST